MQIASKQKRQILSNLIWGIAPEIIIAWALTEISGGDFVEFLIILAAIYAVYLLIWLKKTVVGWVYYKVQGKQIIIKQISDNLRKFKYPEPDDYIDSGIDYLRSVASNDDATVESRINAAMILGELSCQQAGGEMQAFLRTNIAIDEALEQYKATFGTKTPPADISEIDEDIDLSPEEDEKLAQEVQKIHLRCRLLDTDKEARNSVDKEWSNGAKENFEAKIAEFIKQAKSIPDEYYRSAALHRIANSLSVDGQFERAESIIESIKVDFIQDEAIDFMREQKSLAAPQIPPA